MSCEGLPVLLLLALPLSLCRESNVRDAPVALALLRTSAGLGNVFALVVLRLAPPLVLAVRRVLQILLELKDLPPDPLRGIWNLLILAPLAGALEVLSSGNFHSSECGVVQLVTGEGVLLLFDLVVFLENTI